MLPKIILQGSYAPVDFTLGRQNQQIRPLLIACGNIIAFFKSNEDGFIGVDDGIFLKHKLKSAERMRHRCIILFY